MMLCIDTTLAVSGTYTKQNERYIVLILLSIKIVQTSILGESKKTLSISLTISPVSFCKYTYFCSM